MTAHVDHTDGSRPGEALAVGFVGILGSGNIGNDASFEAVLGYLRRAHPDVVIDAMCTGPDRLRSVFGIDATPLYIHLTRRRNRNQAVATKLRLRRLTKIIRIGLKIPRIGLETVLSGLRLTSWVRRHDVVIVPGMGVLETTLRIQSWGTPYWMFVLSLAGRVFRTKVAFVCVGASPIHQRLTRLLYTYAAKLAFYRSYRDDFSRDVLRQQGVDVTADHVYPDLVFGIPPLSDEPGDPRTVGLGVMEFYGNNDDRAQAEILHEAYGNNIKLLARKLLESGCNLRFFIGDTNNDGVFLDEILADLRTRHPGLGPRRLLAPPSESFEDLMAAMTPCGSVVAARFHNVMCAIKIAKPIIATGYSAKHHNLMSSVGMTPYSLEIRRLDVDLIIKQLDELKDRSAKIRETLRQHHAAHARAVERQFTELSEVLFR